MSGEGANALVGPLDSDVAIKSRIFTIRGVLRSQKRGCVKVTIATVAKTPITETAIAKFNKQNPTLEVKHTGKFHDRFLVVDDKELYHFGASLKDLGRHYCAVSKMDAAFIPSIKQRM